jgi:hypothetical protein
MLPGSGFSPYGVDMFPGHGGSGLPSSAYGNPGSQFGVSKIREKCFILHLNFSKLVKFAAF